MHTLKIIGIVVGSLWLYFFVGVHVERQDLMEARGIIGGAEELLAVICVLAIWPIWPFIGLFSKE